MRRDDIPPTADEAPAAGAALRVRTVWISDLHLGTPGCQAVALLDFLKRTECDTLFLVGDIIDGWQLRRQWYWPQTHNVAVTIHATPSDLADRSELLTATRQVRVHRDTSQLLVPLWRWSPTQAFQPCLSVVENLIYVASVHVVVG